MYLHTLRSSYGSVQISTLLYVKSTEGHVWEFHPRAAGLTRPGTEKDGVAGWRLSQLYSKYSTVRYIPTLGTAARTIASVAWQLLWDGRPWRSTTE